MPNVLEGLAVGVFVEVLWDVQSTVQAGRRRGETESSTVWWRAEILSVEDAEPGSRKTKLKYDSGHGMNSQSLWYTFFAFHTQLLDDEGTQLRWRYLECSGDISYERDLNGNTASQNRNSVIEDHMFDNNTLISLNTKIFKFQAQIAGLMANVDSLQRVMLYQAAIVQAIVGTECQSDRLTADTETEVGPYDAKTNTERLVLI